jgi:hypothetical protein
MTDESLLTERECTDRTIRILAEVLLACGGEEEAPHWDRAAEDLLGYIIEALRAPGSHVVAGLRSILQRLTPRDADRVLMELPGAIQHPKLQFYLQLPDNVKRGTEAQLHRRLRYLVL